MNYLSLFNIGLGTLRMNLRKDLRIPLSMHISVTSRCNNRCIYCCFHQRPQADLWDTAVLKKALYEMKQTGTRRIQLTGGEPMTRKDIGEIIDYAKALGFFVGMATNGYEVEKRINELKNVDIVHVSYDGPEKVHAYFRGEKSVGDVRSGVEALKKAGICFSTTTVLTKHNVDYIDDIIEFARKNNILAHFNRLEFFLDENEHFHPAITQVKDLVLSGEQRKHAFEKLIDLKKQKAPVGDSLEYLETARDWAYDDKITSSQANTKIPCWAGRAYAHLEADGMLYACGMGVGRVKGVDVNEHGFKNAWEKISQLENCKSCSHACGVEHNLIFSLNLRTIMNYLRHINR